MTLCTIPRDAVRDLVELLMVERRTYGVQEKEPGRFAFEELKSPDRLVLSYQRTILPPKKYFMPPWETLLRYRVQEPIEVQAVIDSEPFAIVGVHPCDIHAILLEDKAFADVREDVHYFARRRAGFIVGVDCLPDRYCYCASMNTCTVETGFDLFLNALDGQWLIEVGSSAGADLLARFGEAHPASPEDVAAWKTQDRERLRRVPRAVHADLHMLPMMLSHAEEHSAWREWGEKCLSCGQCILVCPTCFCFDVIDEMEFASPQGTRVRRWDGCMLEAFARVTTGENFRKTPTDRLRHRLRRKFQFLFIRYGYAFCVGCGRCTAACPAEIDQVQLLNELEVSRAKEVTF